MQFDIKVMPADEADAVRRAHERNANFLHGAKHKFKKALGLATHNPANAHKNEVLETVDIKAWDKAFKKENKITFITMGDKNYSDFEIAFTTKEALKGNEKLYEEHLQHLGDIYDDIEAWFEEEFGKIPMFSCIHGDEEVPHINMIFNNFRKNEKGKYYAHEDSFFQLHERQHKYPDLDGKKFNERMRKELLKRLRHEFWEKFGKPHGDSEAAMAGDKDDISNTKEAL